MNDQKTIFELSADTRFIHQRLSKAAVGDVVEYEELTKLIGRDIRGAARHSLQSAIRLCQKDGREFGAVMNVGIKRLSPEEIVVAAEDQIARSRNAAKRGMRRLANADFAKLSADDQLRHNATASVLGVLSLFGKQKSVEKVRAAVVAAADALPVGRVLELFRS